MNLSREVIGGAILIGILAPIFWDAFFRVEVQHIVPVADAAEETLYGKEVMIEVVYNWTPERVKEEIQAVFPDAPVMLEVARCESEYKINAFNPTNGSDDSGVFQISELHHGKETARLGLDMMDPIDNLRYARILYDNEGLAPWKWSKPCWKHAL